MQWKLPPLIKVYEALGAIGDGRVTLSEDGLQASVLSSEGDKTYTVKFDPAQNAITANDNGSYWQGYLGYPAIAYLLLHGELTYDPVYAEYLKGFPWKKLNQEFKRDYAKTVEYIQQELVTKQGVNLQELSSQVEEIMQQLKSLHLEKLTPGLRPVK